MKTTVKFVIATIIAATTTLSANAQDFFFDKKYVNNLLISQIKYEESNSGLYKKTYLFEYSYNSFGEKMQTKVYKWNAYKSEWKPDHCITKKMDMDNNTIFELSNWNSKKNNYNEPSQRMVYKQNVFTNNLIYLAFTKDNLKKEYINALPYDSLTQFHAIK